MRPELSWRIVSDGARSGAANMARDHAIAEALRPGTGTVRFYGWSPATLSLGRNEPVGDAYRDFLRLHPEFGVVRRPTGGRAVIHDRELTYAVAVAARAFGGPRQAYCAVNDGLVRGLRRLGVDAVAAGGAALPPDAGPCFMAPAEGEVVVRGRKLVGSAQVRIGASVLQHGSVLLVADQAQLPGASGGAVTLAELLGETPAWERLVDAFSHGLARSLGGRWSHGVFTDRERSLAKEFQGRYGSAKWTWRR